jgi:hypothetical protein
MSSTCPLVKDFFLSFIQCNPMTLPLRAKEYISHDPRDKAVGALPYTKTA